MSNNGQTARDVLAENLAAIRARVGMSSAQELADKVKELGGRLDRAAISKIESKTRNVSLDEALLLAAALDVAPVHLFVALDTNVLMEIAPKVDPVPAGDAREWVRGRRPLPTTNEKTYRTAWIPEDEWEQRNARITQAASTGTTRDLLVTMRDRVAKDVENENTPARDLAALTKRLMEIVCDIEAIDARAEQEASEDAAEVEDGAFDASAV